MRVLVTGFAGYLGPHVVRLLKEHGHYVVGHDVGWFLTNYAEPPVYPDEAFFTDTRYAIRYHATPDAVVHLAGLSNDPLGEIDPALTDEINVRTVLDYIGHFQGTRQVIASSCSVYGAAEMADEETTTHPLTTYAMAKDMVDTEATSLGSNIVSLRFGTLYGFSPGHRLDLVVNRMVWDATRARGITVYGNADRPLTHVEDAARAIVHAVENPLVRGLYNCGGENWRMQDLGREVQRAIEDKYLVSPLLTFRPGGADARDYSATSEKLLATGFEFKHTVKSALPDLIERTQTLPGLLNRYVRLETIKALMESGYLTPNLEKAA